MDLSFTAERTLGKLAKWLRILGFDTHYETDPPQPAETDNRILLTRTRRIWHSSDAGQCILITSDNYFHQLKEVITTLDIRLASIRPFSRCIRCNRPIKPAASEQVYGKVPDHIWETQTHFQACNHCDKIYWPGSHHRQSMEKIEQLFEQIHP